MDKKITMQQLTFLSFIGAMFILTCTIASANMDLDAQSNPTWFWSWKQPPHDIYFIPGGYPFPYITPHVNSVTWGGVGLDSLYLGTIRTNEQSQYPDGIYRSNDQGLSWEHLGEIDLDEDINILMTHPTTPTIIFAGFDRSFDQGGLYRTDDSGEDWESVLPYLGIRDIAFDPIDPNRVYVMTTFLYTPAPPSIPGGLYRSSDAGLTWELILRELYQDVEVNPTSSDLFAIENGNFHHSNDGGESWTKLSESYIQENLIIDRYNPNRMFIYGWAYNGIQRSDDGGQTWNNLTPGLPTIVAPPTVQSAILDLHDSDTIWVGLKYGGMYVSYDAGNSWEAANNGIPFFGGSIAGPQCVSSAIHSNGTIALACSGRSYISLELDKFTFLPLIKD